MTINIMYIILPLVMLLVLIGLGLLFWLKAGVKSKTTELIEPDDGSNSLSKKHDLIDKNHY
ncbi:hypothetical protein GCM10007169_06150 [Shewanella fodinae]|nr:hypothetical protein GCM10007169_06150 [Shewanella fodinae]